MFRGWLLWMFCLLILMVFIEWQCKAYGHPLEFTAAAVFTLHPVSGQPLIISDYYRFYLDWEGNPGLVMVGGLPASGQPRKQITHYRDPVQEVQIGEEVLHFGDDVVCTTLQPPVPMGWRRLLVVTTGQGRAERKKEYIIEGESYEDIQLTWGKYDAYFYNYDTAELLAEVNLSMMYTSLYALESGSKLQRANVRSACLSPSGELAIIVYFKDDYGFWYEKGIWRNNTWVPIPENQPFWQGEYPLYVGPGGWAVYNLRNGDSGYIAFYDPQGKLSAKYIRSRHSWRGLAMVILWRLGTVAATTAAASLLTVLLLALFWHNLPPAALRRRLKSRRAHPQ